MPICSARLRGMTHHREHVGQVLKEWRARRRLSQLDLAIEADISARHLSFVESGRSSPSREILAKLAEQLSMPARAANRLMLAAGYAPVHSERSLDAPDMAAARQAVETVVQGHMPFPPLPSTGTGTSFSPMRRSCHFWPAFPKSCFSRRSMH